MIKAIFFDIDGTLTSFKTHAVPEDTKEALSLAARRGIKLIIATGRHRIEAARALGSLEFDGYVTLNGQYCYAGDRVLRSHPICREDIRRLVRRLEHDPYPCGFVEAERSYINMIDETVRISHEAVDIPLPAVLDPREALDKDIYQLLIYMDRERERIEMPLLENCVTTRWSPYSADVLPKGGNKCAGIQSFLDAYGWDRSEVMAFGDGDNDTEMLQYAGVGIAMGNAADAVKASADYVTGSVDEGGIRDALLRFGLIGC